MENMQLILY